MVGQVAAAVGLMPVQILRVVKTHFQAVFVAGLADLGNDVAAEGSGVHHIVFVYFGMEHSETVVMLAGHNEIFHSAVFCQFYPFFCVEEYRVKCFGQFSVLGVGDSQMSLNPFCVNAAVTVLVLAGQQGIESPVYHHSVLCLFEPFSHVHIV